MKGFFSGNFLANRQEIVSVHGGTWCTILFPASVHSIFLTVKDLLSIPGNVLETAKNQRIQK
ncbi:hypothetical protein [Methanosarcina mazei]|uniref:Uncharacterized protein n=1 Tax=Methanosarcina mazei TaxID=2209 RepID=A0A0F8MPZ0_METMZ|nr:hypothetical protein [Methanosarcina mazei]KKF99310.1 hypothetical protein DU40_10370 [Methanosarcina mazei]KKG04096.1 hypothetical protein DU31_07150 [Methanosarcina mazei]KKG05679.1 hypothetical protein DU47_09295 [Methanosarcina mazei]KKG36477.1 hypothetical protein DU30_08860 [Methanosarcina mazei]KKG37025.1 hypothetical protein DU52_01130 [Methanosarcina mazei]